MSKISIKTDFKNGEKLFDTDLNNNFKVIQAGINANEENLQEVIDEAIVRLDAELEAITADRGWDWNGGDRVTFYKGNTSAVDSREIVNGQMLYNTDTGETALDDNGERIITGSGNVVSVGETQPTNPATKIWIQPSKMVSYAASYVVDSMEGTQTDKSPSVNAVKDYVDNKNVYSTEETVVGKAIVNNVEKPLYRKEIIISSLSNAQEINYDTSISNAELLRYEGFVSLASNDPTDKPLPYLSPGGGTTANIYYWVNKNCAQVTIKTGNDRTSASARVIIEYTKITD